MEKPVKITSTLSIRSIENGYILSMSAGEAYKKQEQSGEIYYESIEELSTAASGFITDLASITAEE